MDTALLLSLLAAQTNASPPALQDLLTRANAAGGSASDPQELLSRLSQGNPTVAAMMQIMNAQNAAAAARAPVVVEGTAVEVSTEEIAELTARLDGSTQEVRTLKAQLHGALEELETLRGRSDLLAAALGACSLCWGQDPRCRACRGHGLPGKSVPDEGLFFEYVLPAVQLMRASRQRSTVVTPLTPVPSRVSGADSTPLRHTS